MFTTLLTLGGVASIIAIGYGMLSIFAGGMSDAPYAGQAEANQGLYIAITGLVVLVACIGIGLYRWLA